MMYVFFCKSSKGLINFLQKLKKSEEKIKKLTEKLKKSEKKVRELEKNSEEEMKQSDEFIQKVNFEHFQTQSN